MKVFSAFSFKRATNGLCCAMNVNYFPHNVIYILEQCE